MQPADGPDMTTWLLCLDSVREVDFDGRKVRRVGGSVPPTAREGDGWNTFKLIGDHQTFVRTGKPGGPTPGSTMLIVWSTEGNTFRGTVGSTMIAAVDLDPTVGSWAWTDDGNDRATVSLTFDGDPVAVTAKPEAGHLLACLLNWASACADGPLFAGQWGTGQIDPDAGELRTLTANGHPVAVFYDPETAGACAGLLNLLPDQINTTMGAVAAVTDISGWGNPEPVWTLPDIDLCRQALANAGLTADDIASIESGGQERLREATRITSTLTEHLAWEDASHWWHHPHQANDLTVTPLEAFVNGEDAPVAAALRFAPDVAARIAADHT